MQHTTIRDRAQELQTRLAYYERKYQGAVLRQDAVSAMYYRELKLYTMSQMLRTASAELSETEADLGE